MYVLSPPDNSNATDSNKTSVLIASRGWSNEILNKLENIGYKKNIDFFHLDEFYILLMYYKYNKLYLPNIQILLTEACTLKCKSFSSFIPYIKNPRARINNILDNAQIKPHKMRY